MPPPRIGSRPPPPPPPPASRAPASPRHAAPTSTTAPAPTSPGLASGPPHLTAPSTARDEFDDARHIPDRPVIDPHRMTGPAVALDPRVFGGETTCRESGPPVHARPPVDEGVTAPATSSAPAPSSPIPLPIPPLPVVGETRVIPVPLPRDRTSPLHDGSPEGGVADRRADTALDESLAARHAPVGRADESA